MLMGTTSSLGAGMSKEIRKPFNRFKRDLLIRKELSGTTLLILPIKNPLKNLQGMSRKISHVLISWLITRGLSRIPKKCMRVESR